ncbi:MAG: DUF935 domain-containing protein [Alphaproteobacteria bacterium]|nr:DUF935 domain-containing protein [Alphaproteobacteria bacterium]
MVALSIKALFNRSKPEPQAAKLAADNQSAVSVESVSYASEYSISSSLTPAKAAAILRSLEQAEQQAIQGTATPYSLTEYFTLIEEMEEKDPHYRAVLQTRKLAVTSLHREATLQPAEGDELNDLEEEILDATKTLIDQAWMDDLVYHACDAVAKGYAVSEINWQSDSGKWVPTSAQPRHPEDFWFDAANTPYYVTASGQEGMPLPYGKYVMHHNRGKSGWIPRAGVAKVALWSWLLKSYSLRDWAAFLDIYGIPMRIGKYHETASKDQINKLRNVVARMASDASAVIPMGMQVEFPQVKTGGGSQNPFQDMAEYLDKQISKLVLGQTMTTDDGASLSQAKVHGDVQSLVVKSDANAIGNAITHQLITPFVQLNWGKNAPVPVLTLSPQEEEDITERLAHAKTLHELGVPLSIEQLRAMTGLTAPSDPEDTIAKANATDPLSTPPTPPTPGQFAAPPTPTFIQQRLEEHAATMIDAIAGRAAQYADYDALIGGLPSLYGDITDDKLITEMALANTIARVAGEEASPANG